MKDADDSKNNRAILVIGIYFEAFQARSNVGGTPAPHLSNPGKAYSQ